MEGEGSGNGGATVGAAAGGGGGSGGVEVEKGKMVEEEPKTKRKMKTTAQLEALESTYVVEPYPSEALRAELSIKLGLTDRQLQMWFCHRRLKDRKAKNRKDGSPSPAPAALAGAGDELMLGCSSGGDIGNDLNYGKSPFSHVDTLQPRVFHHQPGAAVPRIGYGGERPAVKRYYEPPQAISELRAIAFVEAQLGEPIKEDGPILGMEFDPLPPGAFGTPIVTSRQQNSAGRHHEVQIYERLQTSPNKDAKRAIREYQFLPEQPSIRNDSYERALPSHYNGSPTDVHSSRISSSSGNSLLHGLHQASSGYNIPIQFTSLSLLPQQGKQVQHVSPASGDGDVVPRKSTLFNVAIDASYGSHSTTGMENSYMTPERRIIYDEERLEKKRKSEEARIAREVEAHEKRIRKELEKQDLLRRKREEQIRKEMERQDRERRKEEERLMRERLREEERHQREQRREMERRERFLQKESMRAEKMRLKEELRKERDAARLKAANDRANARKIAKESIELIEDEQLELMELAASKKGLPSFLALDTISLDNLDSFRDMLPEFPVKSVQLKRPFVIQPWIDSEENVGNLLMVWRFLITFADVLGLWPFTLDEFLQAFHDYDTRLLGEVHIALLKTIIKDIEDVAITLTTAPGANQSSAVSVGGGHPQIVEGAYTWGFDIRSWQSHLNPLTWPEILRQFALSAGYGPKIKKRSSDQAYLRDDNEDDHGTTIISNLRNGVAAENALAKMQERGFSNPRRSRHLLTPGTVKYAAFHVLSVEGSKGINILELAEKIQKSGLRDLTTSRTPEASISAALSRDTKLFERTAPSTYCVRAPYRKDPGDAEAIIAAAREKVEVFKNGDLENGEEEADFVEKENAERDEDSESEEAEDPEVAGLDTPLKPSKETIHSCEVSGLKVMKDSLEKNGKINSREELTKTTDLGEARISNQVNTIIDDKNPGETWVQGLTEGEYSDLSVQERLDVLVALVSVANEGNSVRIVLEERLEAASALKKQMWAEAQLDKRRMKEDYVTRLHYSSYTAGPLFGLDVKSESPLTNPLIRNEDIGMLQIDPSNVNVERKVVVQEPSGCPDNLLLQQQSAYAFEMSRSQLKSYISHRAEEMYVYRSLPLGQDRRRNRYWQFITSHSLNDPGSGRIFVELRDGKWRLIDSIEDFDALLASLDFRGLRESHLHSMLLKIEVPFKETVKRNLFSNSQGEVGYTGNKETYMNTDDAAEPSSSFLIGLGRNISEKCVALKRYQDYEKWMWEECLNATILCALKCGNRRCKSLMSICDDCHDSFCSEDNHCPSCHKNNNSVVQNMSFPEHVTQCKEESENNPDRNFHALETPSAPLKIRLLKAQLASIEAFIPPEALEPTWSDEARNFWGMKLQMASSAEDLLQILTALEGVIRKDFLSSNYETTKDLLDPCNRGLVFNSSSNEVVAVLPWIPETTSAVALRLMGLDTSICYTQKQKEDLRKDNASGSFMAPPSKYAAVENVTQDMLVEHLHEPDNVRQESWLDAGHPSTSQGRGRGRPGTRERKSQRRITTNSEKSQVRGRRRGRRLTRGKQKAGKKQVEDSSKDNKKKIIFKGTFISGKQEPSKEQTMPIQFDDTHNVSSSSDRSPSDYDNAPVTVDEMIAEDSGGLSRKASQLAEDSDYVIGEDEEEEEEEEEDDDGEHVEEDVGAEKFYEGEGDDYEDNQHNDEDVDEYYPGESDEEGKRSIGGGDQYADMDGDSRYSSSSDYSDQDDL